MIEPSDPKKKLGATEFQLFFQSLDKNSACTDLKAAFPDFKFKDEIPALYICIEAKQGKNPKELENAFKKLLDNILLLLQLKKEQESSYYYSKKDDPFT